jgi:hypothetical protein
VDIEEDTIESTRVLINVESLFRRWIDKGEEIKKFSN